MDQNNNTVSTDCGLRLDIQGFKTTALIETGIEVSLLDPSSLLFGYLLAMGNIPNPKRTRIQQLVGPEIEYIEVLRAFLRADGLSNDEWFDLVICPGLKTTIILGRDFLRGSKIIMNIPANGWFHQDSPNVIHPFLPREPPVKPVEAYHLLTPSASANFINVPTRQQSITPQVLSPFAFWRMGRTVLNRERSVDLVALCFNIPTLTREVQDPLTFFNAIFEGPLQPPRPTGPSLNAGAGGQNEGANENDPPSVPLDLSLPRRPTRRRNGNAAGRRTRSVVMPKLTRADSKPKVTPPVEMPKLTPAIRPRKARATRAKKEPKK